MHVPGGNLDQINEFAYAKDFPECPLTKDQVREIKASWIMFVQKKGSVEAAEKAIRRKLENADSEFAAILYPDKARLRRDRRGVQADMQTGQMNDMKKQQRDLAAIFAATSGGGGAGGGGDANAEDEQWDKEEIIAVLQKIREANKLGEAEDEQKAREAAHKQASRGDGRANGEGAHKRGKSQRRPKESQAKAGSEAIAQPREDAQDVTPRKVSL